MANAAGVSRQTVYSVFGTREDLVSQSMIALASDVFAEISAPLNAVNDPARYIVELIVAARTAVRAHPVLATLLTGDADNPLNEGDAIARATPFAYEILAPMKAMHPDIDTMMADIAQMTLRLALGVILFPDNAIEADDDLRRFLMRWLAPALPTRS